MHHDPKTNEFVGHIDFDQKLSFNSAADLDDFIANTQAEMQATLQRQAVELDEAKATVTELGAAKLELESEVQASQQQLKVEVAAREDAARNQAIVLETTASRVAELEHEVTVQVEGSVV